MRKRTQRGSLYKRNGEWVARWKEDGKRRARVVGRISVMTKGEAQTELAAIVAPGNSSVKRQMGFSDFVHGVFLPFYRRKWKMSTKATNEDRFKHHLTFGNRALGSFTRNELQTFLDQKAAAGLSFSVVAHLRWDLKAILDMAVNDGCLKVNPAALLFIPRECRQPVRKVMDLEAVRQLFAALDVRERLIAKLAVLAGMRPGEVFGLKWSRLEREYADIMQRVYRGAVDSPKTIRSTRWAALSDGLLKSIQEWKALSLDIGPDAWVFPSENPETPMSKDNCWRRNFLPKLQAVGLAWANFQVMRRTHSSLLKELDIDPETRAAQMGHTVCVNENTYTISALRARRDAVNRLEAAVSVN